MTDKSVITCDMEGRIETFGDGAAALFGYAPDEVVGKKRVSYFSPGLVVLEHVPRWLSSAVKDGAFETDTVFVRKDGSEFPARIKITPTFKGGKGGEQIGYCGVTSPLPASDLARARPKISPFTRVFAALVITRAPFLTATLAPVFMGLAFAAWAGLPISTLGFVLALLGAVALHISANTFNDVFDWLSGADPLNNDYFLPFSGGSRAVELRLITVRGLTVIASAALAVAAACGVALFVTGSVWLLALGAIGAFAAFFYTAPPIRLAARRGLGELFVGLCFGPLMTLGVVLATTGVLDLRAAWLGAPIGFLVTAILWANQIPDAKSDALVGKNNLVVTFGLRGARIGYLVLALAASGSLIGLVLAGVLPVLALCALGAFVFIARAAHVIWRHAGDRSCIRASRDTILGHALFGTLLSLALALS